MSKSVKRVVKNSFFQTLGGFGMSGLNFVLILGYGRILGPELFGSLATSQAQVIIWTLLVDLGLSNSLIGALTSAEGGRTELSRQGFRARDLLFRVLAVRLTGACVALGAVYIFARAHHPNDAAKFWQDMAFTPFLFATAIQETAVAFAVYRHRQGLGVLAKLAGIFLTVVLTLWLAFRGSSIAWLLVSQSWGGLFGGAVILGYFFFESLSRKRSGDTRRVERANRGPWGKEAWSALASDAWPYAITFAVFVVWQRLDQIAVTRMLGLQQGGQYAMAVRMITIPLLVATSISLALFPDLQRIGRDAPDHVRVILGAVSKLLWRYGVLITAFMLLGIGYLLVPLVPQFKAGMKLLPFFVPGVWAFWMQSFLMNALFGLRRYRMVVQAHLIALACYVPALYFFTLWFGIRGVVGAFDIFCLAMCFFGFRAARKAGVLPKNYKIYSAFTADERALVDRATHRGAGEAS